MGATARRAVRTWTGLLGFAAIEAAVFVRYTDIGVLGAWPLARLPLRALLGAVTATDVVAAMFGLGILSYTSMRTCPFTAVCATASAKWRFVVIVSYSPPIAGL